MTDAHPEDPPDLEAAEDELEARHREAVAKAARPPGWLLLLLLGYMVLSLATDSLQYRDVHGVVVDGRDIAADTNRRVRVEIGQKDRTIDRLEKRVADYEKQVADAEHVQAQATYWITRLAQQVITLGGSPGEILLGPQYPIPGQEAPPAEETEP